MPVHCANKSLCPCGYCQLAVGWTPAVSCDQCEVWYHKSCLGMTSQSYERLNSTVSWYCPKCESTNVSTTFFQEWFLDTRNSFAVLDKSVQSIDPVFTPTIHSTPCETRVKRVVRAPRRQSTSSSEVVSSQSSRSSRSSQSSRSASPASPEASMSTIAPKGNNLRTLIANANGIRSKLATLEAACDYLKPDVIIISETKVMQCVESRNSA